MHPGRPTTVPLLAAVAVLAAGCYVSHRGDRIDSIATQPDDAAVIREVQGETSLADVDDRWCRPKEGYDWWCSTHVEGALRIDPGTHRLFVITGRSTTMFDLTVEAGETYVLRHRVVSGDEGVHVPGRVGPNGPRRHFWVEAEGRGVVFGQPPRGTHAVVTDNGEIASVAVSYDPDSPFTAVRAEDAGVELLAQFAAQLENPETVVKLQCDAIGRPGIRKGDGGEALARDLSLAFTAPAFPLPKNLGWAYGFLLIAEDAPSYSGRHMHLTWDVESLNHVADTTPQQIAAGEKLHARWREEPDFCDAFAREVAQAVR